MSGACGRRGAASNAGGLKGKLARPGAPTTDQALEDRLIGDVLAAIWPAIRPSISKPTSTAA